MFFFLWSFQTSWKWSGFEGKRWSVETSQGRADLLEATVVSTCVVVKSSFRTCILNVKWSIVGESGNSSRVASRGPRQSTEIADGGSFLRTLWEREHVKLIGAKWILWDSIAHALCLVAKEKSLINKNGPWLCRWRRLNTFILKKQNFLANFGEQIETGGTKVREDS